MLNILAGQQSCGLLLRTKWAGILHDQTHAWHCVVMEMSSEAFLAVWQPLSWYTWCYAALLTGGCLWNHTVVETKRILKGGKAMI